MRIFSFNRRIGPVPNRIHSGFECTVGPDPAFDLDGNKSLARSIQTGFYRRLAAQFHDGVAVKGKEVCAP